MLVIPGKITRIKYMQGRACSVCVSPRLGEVDQALIDGGKLIPVAGKFGLSKSALSRHKNNCLAPRMAAAVKTVAHASQARDQAKRASAIAAGQLVPTSEDIATLSGLVSRLSRSLDRLEGAADDAARSRAFGALAALSGQIHKGIEGAGRLQGLYAPAAAPETRPAFSIHINLPTEASPPATYLKTAQEAEGALPGLTFDWTQGSRP